MNRAEELRQHLLNCPEKTILVVTHGWYLRLLKLFFTSSTPTFSTSISYNDLVEVQPPKYGEFFEIHLADDNAVVSEESLVSDDNAVMSDEALVTEEAVDEIPSHMHAYGD